MGGPQHDLAQQDEASPGHGQNWGIKTAYFASGLHDSAREGSWLQLHCSERCAHQTKGKCADPVRRGPVCFTGFAGRIVIMHLLFADEVRDGVMKLKPKAVSRPKLSDVRGAFVDAGK